MNEASQPAGDPEFFRTTRWSRVMRVRGADAAEAREALSSLCRDSWRPLYHFARRKGYTPHDAQDLTQGFILSLLESDSFGRADPARGRFRTFLLSAFTHFLAKQRRESAALKRGGGLGNLSLDEKEAEAMHLSLASDMATPDQAYELAWGLALLERAMERLRRKYEEAGRSDLFAALQPLITGKKERPGYQSLGEALGMSESAITAAMHRMRKTYGGLLREEIAATVADAGDVDDELRHLMSVLSGPVRVM